MILGQHKAAQFRPEVAIHPARQRRHDQLPVRRQPALPAIADAAGPQDQVLNESSSGGDMHPSALSEPDVRLSPHPAPTLQPPAWNRKRLCLRHRLLPSLVGRPPRPECRVPSLRRRYPASTVLRTRPPLRLASVLGSSGVCPLEVSLGIEATGSHVPHKSLSLV